MLGNETDMEDLRIGSTSVHVTEGQGLCTARGTRRMRNIMAIKHLGVGGWMGDQQKQWMT